MSTNNSLFGRITSLTVASALVVTTGCAKIAEINGWCPNIPGHELYRGGQVIGDEKGNPAEILLERDAIVTDTGVNTYSVTVGHTLYRPDDGELNLSVWEDMTAVSPESLLPPYPHHSKFGYASEPPYPEHLRACVERDGTIVLAQETLFPLNTKEKNREWLVAEVEQKLTNVEREMDLQKYEGGRERKG